MLFVCGVGNCFDLFIEMKKERFTDYNGEKERDEILDKIWAS